MTRALGHEPSDAPPGAVATGLVALLGLVAVGALVAWALVAIFQKERPAAAAKAFDRAAAAVASPRLEVDARADRLALERQAESRLTGYGWSDRSAGLARIPIERAMALQVAAGWPDKSPGPGAGSKRGRP